MTINLSEITFSYDFFSLPLPKGNTLIMNLVDECVASDGGETSIGKASGRFRKRRRCCHLIPFHVQESQGRGSSHG